MSRTNNFFDRFINPDDGSRKRKKSQVHKSDEDYKRYTKTDIQKLLDDLKKEKEKDENF